MSDYINYGLNYAISSDLATAIDTFEVRLQRLVNDTLQIKVMGEDLLEEKATVLSSEMELAMLTAIIYTGINSAGYWTRKHDKWAAFEAELIGASPSARGSDNPWYCEILWGDCIGAARGGIRGAVVGATGGSFLIPGVGTVTGAAAAGLAGMIMGAVGGSAIGAIEGYVRVHGAGSYSTGLTL